MQQLKWEIITDEWACGNFIPSEYVQTDIPTYILAAEEKTHVYICTYIRMSKTIPVSPCNVAEKELICTCLIYFQSHVGLSLSE